MLIHLEKNMNPEVHKIIYLYILVIANHYARLKEWLYHTTTFLNKYVLKGQI